MSVRRLLASAVATVALAIPAAVLIAAPAVAAPAGSPAAQTYHGVFTGVHYEGCDGGAPSVPVVTGVWNISALGTTSAAVSVEIMLDGRHHVSFGTRVAQVTTAPSTVTVRFPTLAGELTIDLTGGDLTYAIAPYDYGGLSCRQVTYTGVLGR